MTIIKRIKKALCGDRSPDIDLRYLPALDLMRECNLADKKILEVGSGDFGITPYLRREVVGLDVEFERPGPYLRPVEYSGSGFPFPDDSFDFVLSVDSLEHVPPAQRQKTVNEMIRVAREAVVIVVPCGSAAFALDRELAGLFSRIHGTKDKYFTDHLRNGLPEAAEIREMLMAPVLSGKRAVLMSEKPLLNIGLRRFLMRAKISPHFFPSIIYYLFLLLMPLRDRFNYGICYRRLFYATINK